MGQIYEINDVRKGNKLNVDNQPFVVVSVDFRKPGKGTPSTVVKMKNMISGAVLERTYKSGEKLDGADIEEREMTFSYAEGEHLVFMDSATYEQLHVDAKALEESRGVRHRVVGGDVPVVRDRQRGEPVAVLPVAEARAAVCVEEYRLAGARRHLRGGERRSMLLQVSGPLPSL